MVILVGSQKGGVGKTTIATNLAAWLVKQGADVLLVDADDQGSAADFTAWRESNLEKCGYTLVQLTGINVRKQIEALRPKYDHIVIDTGGRDTTSQRAAMFVCDIYLSPFAPRSYDLWTVTKVATLIDEIQAGRAEPFTAYSFLSKADIKSADNREVAQALQDYPQLTFLPFAISNRKAFANSASKGLAVFEMDEPDRKAVAELDALFNHILHGNLATTAA
ncbi:AAA family ATPase [Fibrella forsythiae]|uniref:AAA family ATPase n=1 Tax=Fibrella forsythiae TaxID=2817061 RepID=A0ABS3JSI5_9BACT|nr:AAA family ATPase [Fibrella forsythiae]MBO0952961.1 AAA family ATPase [Fibrella forsythiae]RYF73831.1 MAG: chromosome partitioning protein ParA [Cytophagaceae bacterium]